MIAKKSKRKDSAERNGTPSDWRASLKRRLSQVRAVDAVFVVKLRTYIQVYSVLEEFDEKITKTLMKKEEMVEKDHPDLVFDFHTRVHQGRPPHRAVPHGAEQVFLR